MTVCRERQVARMYIYIYIKRKKEKELHPRRNTLETTKRDCSFSKFTTRRNNNLENVEQKFFDAKWKATLLIFDRLPSRPSTKINVSFNNRAKLERSISRIGGTAISICTQSSNAFAVRSRSLDDPSDFIRRCLVISIDRSVSLDSTRYRWIIINSSPVVNYSWRGEPWVLLDDYAAIRLSIVSIRSAPSSNWKMYDK